MMAQFAVLSRSKPEARASSPKMRVYDGENLKDTDPKAKSYQEYRDYAGVDEGMTGAIHPLRLQGAPGFQLRPPGSGRQPVHLMYVLEQQIAQEQFPPEPKALPSSRNTSPRATPEFINKEIQTAYLESYSEYGQNIFDRYVTYADFWIQDQGSATQHRRDPRPQRAQRRTGEDRETGLASVTQGLPQRGGQLRAARPGPTTTARTRAGPATRSSAR